ncbi:hypothetical protein [Acidovorax sp. NCPPB 4044]|uniref:hypothetical protein n=1 Tax=Acidovorax sp. NCPPB 4044 TaxID=2940490 RepID=UPI0023025E73|nr:hypothetical protein [Acidovorax sp. NCPPB 4044]MDA8520886.1 hypothetical protein [Acidovorax sp. NCPPB 4044]
MANKAKGRTLSEFGTLRSGEQKLLDACAAGSIAMLGDKRPDEKSQTNAVRAEFIRFLALGGDEAAPVHEKGLWLYGAWIEGSLDLAGGTAATSLRVINSHFCECPIFDGTRIEGTLNLAGSFVPGMTADDLHCKGNVYFIKDFSAKGEVRLMGAQIGGDLNFTGAKLDGQEGNALSADRAVIQGGVFLSGGFQSIGDVRLLGAQIGGNLQCTDARFLGKNGNAFLGDGAVIQGDVFFSDGFNSTGDVRLLGAQISGDLNCAGAKFEGSGGDALSADGIFVRGTFFFRGLNAPVDNVRMAFAKVGQLADDTTSWGHKLVLDGFVYDHLAVGSPTDAPTRLKWLRRQNQANLDGQNFCPQPWKHLQKVLRSMGHIEDARQVAIAQENHLRSIGLIGQTPGHWRPWRRWAHRQVAQGLHIAFRALIGYGYRPLRLGAWMLGVWLACAGLYWAAALHGVMAPSNPLVFQNLSAYKSCTPNWYLCSALPGEYTGFSPLAYSLDVLLPFVNLQQEQDWAPKTPTPLNDWPSELFTHWSLEHVVRLAMWFEILFGWVASLLLAAVVSGLTKRQDDSE